MESVAGKEGHTGVKWFGRVSMCGGWGWCGHVGARFYWEEGEGLWRFGLVLLPKLVV